MRLRLLPLLLLAALLAGCGEDATTPAADYHSSESHHGAETELGMVTIAGKEFRVVQLGDVVPGREGAFEIYGTGMDDAALKSLRAYVWVEADDGTALSPPEKGLPGGDKLHFHVTPRKGEKTATKVVLRLAAEKTDQRGSLPLQ